MEFTLKQLKEASLKSENKRDAAEEEDAVQAVESPLQNLSDDQPHVEMWTKTELLEMVAKLEANIDNIEKEIAENKRRVEWNRARMVQVQKNLEKGRAREDWLIAEIAELERLSEENHDQVQVENHAEQEPVIAELAEIDQLSEENHDQQVQVENHAEQDQLYQLILLSMVLHLNLLIMVLLREPIDLSKLSNLRGRK